MKVAPVSPRKERRSMGSKPNRYLLTVTVIFIFVGWIVQMNL